MKLKAEYIDATLAVMGLIVAVTVLTALGCKHLPIPGVDQHEPNHKIIQPE